MGFDTVLQLVADRPYRQVVLEAFEGGFHFRQLNVKAPQLLGRTLGGEVAAQQIAAFPLARLAHFVFAQSEGQLRALGLALHHPPAGHPPVLHQAVIAVLLAAFLSCRIAQEHNDCRLCTSARPWEQGRSSLQPVLTIGKDPRARKSNRLDTTEAAKN